MSKNGLYILTTGLFAVTFFSGMVLSSSVLATDSNNSVDNVSVGVPVSCSMGGTGMDSHTASIPNGTYQGDIGTTTINILCNDEEGFAIYAIGYTNDEYGNTDLVGTNSSDSIITGTETSGSTSNWSMKLATNSSAAYPLEIESGFDDYIEVPPQYELVAYRDSSTDMGSSAVGASLTTTYAAFVSRTQTADTYNGQVKYTLVHPASVDAPIPSTEINVDVEVTEEGYDLNEEVEYAITITNTGSYDAENIVVRIGETSDEWEFSTLLAGASEQVVTFQTIKEPHIIAGTIPLNVEVTGDNIETVTKTITTEVADPNPSFSINLNPISSSSASVTITNDGNISLIENTITLYARSSSSDPWQESDHELFGEINPGGTSDDISFDVSAYNSYKVVVRAKTSLGTYIEKEVGS